MHCDILVENRDFRPTLLRYVTFALYRRNSLGLLSSVCDVRNFVQPIRTRFNFSAVFLHRLILNLRDSDNLC